MVNCLKQSTTLITPLKVIVSGSYIFREAADVKNQRGFITADIEYVNYKGASFKPIDKTDAASKDYYSSLT